MSAEANRIKAIYFAAAEKATPAERATYLDEACVGDANLRQRVEDLLQVHDQADCLLDQPAAEHLTRQGDLAGLDFLEPSTKAGSLGRLGHYQVLEVVGRGGMGIVLKAFDEKLHRVVAIKVLAPALAAGASARQRFVREARAAAAVTHENVIAIHAVEDAGPVPYIVMQFIQGCTLQEKLDRSGLLRLEAILRIGLQTAEGLAAAHRHGLIHRDIKPANILLENGIERVKITDFGLARTADDASLTQSGYIAGTPAYMSPEQATGQKVDHRSDLFSLGSVLYTLCTGHPPFRASTTMAVLKRVCEDTPRPIRESNPDIPEWFVTVVAKLQAKEPGQRFATAAEVVGLLSRCLTQLQMGADITSLEALAAKPSGAKPRPSKRFLTGRRLSVAGVLLVGVLLVLAGWFTRHWWLTAAASSWRPRAPLTPEELAALPDPLDDWRREAIPASLLSQVGGRMEAPAELIGILGDGRFWMPRSGETHWPAQTADGRLLAIASGSVIAIYDAQTGALIRTLEGLQGRAFTGSFSSDGQRFVCGSDHGEIKIWDMAGVSEPTSIAVGRDHVWKTLFTADNAQIISYVGSADVLKIWDAKSGRELKTLAPPTGVIADLAFNRTHTRLAIAGLDGVVKIWDWPSGEPVKTLEEQGEPVNRVRWSPDGSYLVSGSRTRAIIWDAATLQPLQTLQTPADGIAAFSPDSQTLVTAPHQLPEPKKRAFARWDVKTGAARGVREAAGTRGFLVGDLSVDGRTVYLMTCSPAAEPRLGAYDALTGEERFPTLGHSRLILSLAFNPDGSLLASGGMDGRVCLWNLTRQPSGALVAPEKTLTGHSGEVWSVAFSPDGRLLASGSRDGTIRLWNVADGQEVQTLPGHSQLPALLAFSPDGETLAAAGEDGAVNLWTVKGGQPKDTLRWHVGAVLAVAYSPDGRWLASGGEDKTVQLVELASGRPAHSFRGSTVLRNLAFSPDSKTLAAASQGPGPSVQATAPSVRLWDVTTKRGRTLTEYSHPVLGLAYHPGGGSVATGSLDGTVRLWDTNPAKNTFRTFEFGQLNHPVPVAFTTSGRHLAVGLANGTIAILTTPASFERTLGQGPKTAIQPGGPALLLTGQDRVELANTAGMIDLKGAFTVEMWVQFDKGVQYFAGDETWPAVADVKRPHGWVLRIHPDQRMNFRMDFTAGATIADRPGLEWAGERGGDVIMFDDGWHHLAISKNREGTTVFLDGRPYLYHEASNITYMNSPFNMFLGATNIEPDRRVNCRFKAFRVSGKQLYREPFTPPVEFTKSDDTLLLLDFSVGKGATLPDLSGHGHHGTIRGGSWSSSEPAKQ